MYVYAGDDEKMREHDTVESTIIVTGFAKRGLIHASSFSTLRRHNSAYSVGTALKICNKTFLSWN